MPGNKRMFDSPFPEFWIRNSEGGWTPLFVANIGQTGRWTIVPEVDKEVSTENSTIWLRNSPLLERVSTMWSSRGRSWGEEWGADPFSLVVGVKYTHGAEKCNLCQVNKQTVLHSDTKLLQGLLNTYFAWVGYMSRWQHFKGDQKYFISSLFQVNR